MLKTLAAQIKQYKRSTLLTPLFTVLEVVMEVLIPFVTAAGISFKRREILFQPAALCSSWRS